MEVFVVRIYRNDKKNPEDLVGIAEEVGAGGEKVFRNLDELWKILISTEEEKEE